MMSSSQSSDFAFQKPSIERAWKDFIKHFPALCVAWVLAFIVYLGGIIVLYFCLYLGLFLDILHYGTNGPEGPLTILGLIVGLFGGLPLWLVFSTLLAMIFAIPAMYYNGGEERVTAKKAFNELNRRRIRYIFAGVFHTAMMLLGYMLCFLPGLIIAMLGPIYINKIFLTDQSILEAFNSSFRSVFGSRDWPYFLLISFLGGLIVALSSLLTCNVGYFITCPMYAFYIQNYAYHKGILSKV